MKEQNKGMASGSSRRDFLKLAGIGGVATASVMLAGCSTGSTAGDSSSDTASAAATFDSETDVLVLGGGAGGCFAANYAMRNGAAVTLVEADSKVGGTVLLSGGFYHTWDITPENVDQMLASADPHMRQVFINKWVEVCDWVLNESGAPAEPLDMDYPLYGAALKGFATSGKTGAPDRQAFLEYMIDGATVILDTFLEDIIVSDEGAAIGAVVKNRDGSIRRIGAKSVIIATGSYQANKGKIEERLGRWADCACCRATPYNKGVGIDLALRYGARISKGAGHFYGHLNPWPQLTPATEEEFDEADLAEVAAIMGAVQKFATEGISINSNGLRFTDEGPENYVGDNYLANDSTQEKDGRIFVVIDSAQDHSAPLGIITDAGGVVLTSDTIDGLAEQMQAYKINPSNFKRTVAEYQAAATAGTTEELLIPKSPMPTGYITKLDTPPYYAVQAAAGISGFYGGIETSDACEVLGADDQPIAGLYAAPMASGGVFYKEYGGGLALCASFGAIAGETAAAYAKSGS